MAYSNLIIDALRSFGNTPTVYLRTKQSTAGSSLFLIDGTVTYEDLPIAIPIAMKTLEDKDIVADGDKAVKKYRILIMYDDVITEDAVDAAAGIVVGGAYSRETQQIAGGDFYEFEEGTAVKQCIDGSTPSGVFVVAHYAGEVSND